MQSSSPGLPWIMVAPSAEWCVRPLVAAAAVPVHRKAQASRPCYQARMNTLKWMLVLAVMAYGGFVGLLYFAQRGMMYFPDTTPRLPAENGFPQGMEAELRTEDGERLLAWYAAPQGDGPVVLYFQGNGGGLNLRAHRFARLAASGIGVLAVNYRGYGGSSGRPSEPGLLQDAEAAYQFAASRYPADRIVLWGESLGTGVAVALASTRPVARVLLESPFTSTADIAASLYWFVPVRLLMHDQFRSDQRIGKVTAPVLVLHGERDNVVPIRFGERLYALIRSPKRFIRMPQAGHNDHDEHGGFDLVKSFLATGLE
jgi:fermentation-respiration switch protein FrsA (DUF1100 family)